MFRSGVQRPQAVFCLARILPVMPAHPSRRDARCLMVNSRGRFEWKGAEDRLRGRLDAMQRLTQGVRVAVIELNVVSGLYARPDADRSADNERHGLGFGFAHGLGRRSIVATLVKELVCELVDEHRGGVGWRERLEDRDAAWL